MAVKNSFKNLVLCLGLVTLACAFILGTVYEMTKSAVQAAAVAKSEAAIASVAPSFETLQTEKDVDGAEYYVAKDAAGEAVSLVVKVETSKGFAGKIKMMVGFLPDGTIYDTAVLEHAETPGLGAKCTEDTFKGQFKGFNPLQKNLSVVKDGGQVDAITAATITSRAYCDALQQAVKKFNSLSGTVFPQTEPEIIVEEGLENE